jgi:hypothetical protein
VDDPVRRGVDLRDAAVTAIGDPQRARPEREPHRVAVDRDERDPTVVGDARDRPVGRVRDPDGAGAGGERARSVPDAVLLPDAALAVDDPDPVLVDLRQGLDTGVLGLRSTG